MYRRTRRRRGRRRSAPRARRPTVRRAWRRPRASSASARPSWRRRSAPSARPSSRAPPSATVSASAPPRRPRPRSRRKPAAAAAMCPRPGALAVRTFVYIPLSRHCLLQVLYLRTQSFGLIGRRSCCISCCQQLLCPRMQIHLLMDSARPGALQTHLFSICNLTFAHNRRHSNALKMASGVSSSMTCPTAESVCSRLRSSHQAHTGDGASSRGRARCGSRARSAKRGPGRRQVAPWWRPLRGAQGLRAAQQRDRRTQGREGAPSALLWRQQLSNKVRPSLLSAWSQGMCISA